MHRQGKKKNILITGQPGVGKTTLFKRLAKRLTPYRPVGFYTEEIRERGSRRGFALASLDGMRGVLSHVDLQSPVRIGKFRVDIVGFEQFLDLIPVMASDRGVIMVDEIGKMESLSDKFQRLIREALGSHKPVIATIASIGTGFITEVKKREDVTIIEVTQVNRDRLLTEIMDYVDSLLFSHPPLSDASL